MVGAPLGKRGGTPVSGFRAARSPVASPEILITSHSASTLGDALNSLLVLFAFALRIGSSIGLPWIPRQQFYIASNIWYKGLLVEDGTQRHEGLDLTHVLDFSQLKKLPMHFGQDEVIWAQAELNATLRNTSRVGLNLKSAGTHWIPYDLYEPSALRSGKLLSCDAFWSATGSDCKASTRWQFVFPPLNTSAAFEELVQSIQGLVAAYRGPSPLVIAFQGNGEMSCIPWGFSAEYQYAVSHLELAKPVLPSITTAAAADGEFALAGRCAYSFWRFMPHVWYTMRGQGNGSTISMTPSTSTASIYHFALRQRWGVSIKVSQAADDLAAVLRSAGVDCIYLDIKTDDAHLSPLSSALQQHGLQSISFTVPDQYPGVPSPKWLRPPMEANVLKLYYARHSRLFICEAGSQWCDLVTMLRTEAGLPTLIASASTNGTGIVFEEAHRERCVRIRGRCVRPDKSPFRDNTC